MPTLIDALNLKSDPTPLQLIGEAGFLWSYLSRWGEAEDAFKALVALVPQDACGYLGLSEVQLMQNKYRQAQQYAEQSVKAAIGRTNANTGDRSIAARAFVIIAKAQMHQKKADEAKQSYMKAIELEPNGVSGRHAADMIEYGTLVGAV